MRISDWSSDVCSSDLPFTRVAIDDGWGADGASPGSDGFGEPPGLPPAPPTEVIWDATRSILTRNSSPDVPFDRPINPYRGCVHGSIYCFSRPSHAWLGYSPGLDFETKIIDKQEAAQLLRRDLARKDSKPELSSEVTGKRIRNRLEPV